MLISGCVLCVCRNSTGSATTWPWSSSNPPKQRGGGEEERGNIFFTSRQFDPLLSLSSDSPLWRPFCSIHPSSLPTHGTTCSVYSVSKRRQTFSRKGCLKCDRRVDVTSFTPLCLLYSFLSASGPLYGSGPIYSPLPRGLGAASAAVLQMHGRCHPSSCKLPEQLFNNFKLGSHPCFHTHF